jgi:hypothetical protein
VNGRNRQVYGDNETGEKKKIVKKKVKVAFKTQRKMKLDCLCFRLTAMESEFVLGYTNFFP